MESILDLNLIKYYGVPSQVIVDFVASFLILIIIIMMIIIIIIIIIFNGRSDWWICGFCNTDLERHVASAVATFNQL